LSRVRCSVAAVDLSAHSVTSFIPVIRWSSGRNVMTSTQICPSRPELRTLWVSRLMVTRATHGQGRIMLRHGGRSGHR
jgi:hypothetical protein